MKPKKPTAFETDNCDEVNEEADVGRGQLVAGCGGWGGCIFKFLFCCLMIACCGGEGGSFYYCCCTILLIPVNQLKITSYPFPYTSGGLKNSAHPIWARSANVLGIINSTLSGKNKTRPQTCRQWKSPMLILDLVSTLEWDTLPIHSSQSGH